MFYFRDKMLDKPQGSFQPSLVYVQFYFLIGDRFCDVVAFDVIQTSSVYVLCEKQFLDAVHYTNCNCREKPDQDMYASQLGPIGKQPSRLKRRKDCCCSQ